MHSILARNEIEEMRLEEAKKLLDDFTSQRSFGSLIYIEVWFDKCAVAMLSIFGVILILSSIFVGVFTSLGLRERKIEFSNFFSVDLSEFPKNSPIHIYYEMDLFYSNHENFVSSRPSEFWTTASCHNFRTNEDLLSIRYVPGIEPTSDAIFPCGLVPFSYFDYSLNSEMLDLRSTSLIEEWHIYASLMSKESWLSILEDQFRNWMSTPFDPSFRNLWKTIPNLGNYENVTFSITPGTFPVGEWLPEENEAEIKLVFSHLSSFGTQQMGLAITFAVFGIVFFFKFT
eukprot:GHVP01001867.1.p1 GENE.GHVP01001867.1~~GHVP01001867.1.p1  ORF type:complete len:286 (-),score=45.33 GHVP01001867.1:68-925(-)